MHEHDRRHDVEEHQPCSNLGHDTDAVTVQRVVAEQRLAATALALADDSNEGLTLRLLGDHQDGVIAFHDLANDTSTRRRD